MAACSTVPLTGRRQANLVSDTEMQQMAAQSYNQLLSDPSTKVVNNTAQSRKVKEIGGKIATAVTKFMNENGYADQIAGYKWEFNLIDSKEVNAWCMPGGKVAVYTGILPVTLTDAGLATVMGHEIAHAVAKHSNERYSNQMIAQGLGSVLGGAITNSQAGMNVFNQVFGIGAQAGVLLPNSRKQESEADRLGLTFMAMAGYDPAKAVEFWQRMMAQNKGQAPPEFLSTHPSDATRISDIKKYLPEALKYYKR
ncbi:M48 family metallopeptidase [Pedobacter sp. SD-b]|uniref:M48 family metallopeptidase n=2 Tax=Pedobacter segetis TaxID=2793069 RepID=A0ABS1BIA0_9SPHI|nr:M48 family metallopeptidase [Pedobacter segetis]